MLGFCLETQNEDARKDEVFRAACAKISIQNILISFDFEDRAAKCSGRLLC